MKEVRLTIRDRKTVTKMFSISCDRGLSWVWHEAAHVTISKFLRGDRFNFWEDAWIDQVPLRVSIPDLYAMSNKKEIFDCWDRENQAWNLGFRRGFPDRELNRWVVLIQKCDWGMMLIEFFGPWRDWESSQANWPFKISSVILLWTIQP